MMPSMRRIAVALALVAGALSIADYLAWRAAHIPLTALAADSGLAQRRPELAAQLARETVPSRAGVKLAWGLLDLEVDRAWLDELPGAERRTELRRGRERLVLSDRLARDAMTRQPASWQAATVLGASRYLAALRGGRQDLPISAWRDPLRFAMSLAPAYPEPAVFLASAYLSSWSSLTPADRDELLPVLGRALEDRRGLELLLPHWVRLAPSLGRLLEPIPDRPAAWRALGRQFLIRGDLERFAMAHRRQLDSLPADMAQRLRSGLDRLRAGHTRSGVGLLATVLAEPADLAHVQSFSAALEALPGEAVGKALPDLQRWQDWAEDLCSVARCPLPDETARRLAAVTRAAAPRPARAGPDLPARRLWSRGDWRRRGSVYVLPLRTDRAARGLRLRIHDVPPEGAALELRWDGGLLDVVAVAPGEPLVHRFAVEPGAHLVEIVRAGGRPLPAGELSLEPGAPSG